MTAPPPCTTPLRALVIGAGPMADHIHLPILAELRDAGELELALVCDLDHHRAAAARRKFAFADEGGDAWAALGRDDIDLVYIFASAQIHGEFGLAAIERGKHLFVEKPVAPSYAVARRMASLAAERGLIAVGGHNRRFLPDLAAGAGGWREAEVTFDKPMAGKRPPFGARSWLSANGIHALDALLFRMGGPPDEIAASSDGTHVFTASMRWSHGARAEFRSDNQAGVRLESYRFRSPGQESASTEPDIPSRLSFVAEHRAFLGAVSGGPAPAHSLDDIAASLHVCELIEDAHRGAVMLPDVRPLPPVPAPCCAILVSQPASLQPALARLLPRYRLISPTDVASPRPDVVGALFGRGAEPLSTEVLDRLPGLKVAGIAGLSVARYHPEVLLARRIAIINAVDAHADSVAEFALGLAILGRRRAFQGHEAMREGDWGTVRTSPLRRLARAVKPMLQRGGLGAAVDVARRHVATPAPTTPRDLKGATVGLIGWGANARAFAARLQACAAKVLVHSEHGGAGELAAPLDRVLAADIVSLHRGLTPRTRHAIGAAELAKLRAGTVLINIARGGLIEPEALVARLRRGDIFACLDTYDLEPLPRRHPLRRLPNVFLTPHIAGGSPDMQEEAAEEVVSKVASYLDGGAVESLSRDRLEVMT